MKTFTAIEKNTGRIIKRWTSEETDKNGKKLDENFSDDTFPLEYELEVHDLGDIPHWRELIRVRNKYLKESDWTQLKDSQLSKKEQLAWDNYRQELRDLPQKIKDPKKVKWPKKPEFKTQTSKMLEKILFEMENSNLDFTESE